MTIHDDTVVGNVALERVRQNEKWGEQNHPDGTGPQTRPLENISEYMGNRYLVYASAGAFADNARELVDDINTDGTIERSDGTIVRISWADILLEEVFEALAEDDEVRLVTELVQTAAVAEQWAAAILRRLDAANRTPKEQ